MVRSMIVAAGALLLAAVAGVMTAEAQSGKKGKKANPTRVSDVKKVEQTQKQFNDTIDAMRRLASIAGPARVDGFFIARKKTYKDFNDDQFVSGDVKGEATSLDQLVKLQKQVNGRFAAMKKAGKLTEIDKKVLNARTLTDLQTAVGGR